MRGIAGPPVARAFGATSPACGRGDLDPFLPHDVAVVSTRAMPRWLMRGFVSSVTAMCPWPRCRSDHRSRPLNPSRIACGKLPFIRSVGTWAERTKARSAHRKRAAVDAVFPRADRRAVQPAGSTGRVSPCRARRHPQRSFPPIASPARIVRHPCGSRAGRPLQHPAMPPRNRAPPTGRSRTATDCAMWDPPPCRT